MEDGQIWNVGLSMSPSITAVVLNITVEGDYGFMVSKDLIDGFHLLQPDGVEKMPEKFVGHGSPCKYVGSACLSWCPSMLFISSMLS